MLELPLRAGTHLAAFRQMAVGVVVVAAGFVLAFGITACLGLTAGICALALIFVPAMIAGGRLGRRFDRALDQRRPGVRFDGTILTVPVGGTVRRFDLTAPVVVDCGWWSNWRQRPMNGPRSAAEGVWVYVAQNGVAVLFSSDDGTDTAEQAGLLCALEPKLPADEVRVWAADALKLARATAKFQAA